MAVETTDVLIVGGGQAGIAMSEHLSDRGIPHLVLERDRIAERWRTCRWDSLVANGPAWHDRFPNMSFEGIDPYAFAPKDRIVQYFEAYAARIKAPIRCGVNVTSVRQLEDGRFRAETSAGVIEARKVVAATGPFQTPVIPAVVPESAGIFQVHSAGYRNPAQLPPGAVLVVGAGASGTQIAEELLASGRKVFLSVGPHDRPPIRYRGRDFVWWLGVLGKWDAAAKDPGTEHVTIAVPARTAAGRWTSAASRATGWCWWGARNRLKTTRCVLRGIWRTTSGQATATTCRCWTRRMPT